MYKGRTSFNETLITISDYSFSFYKYIFKNRTYLLKIVYFFFSDSKRVIESYLISRAQHKSLLQLHPKPAASKHRYLRAPGGKKLSAIICRKKRKKRERKEVVHTHTYTHRNTNVYRSHKFSRFTEQNSWPTPWSFQFFFFDGSTFRPQLHSSEMEIRRRVCPKINSNTTTRNEVSRSRGWNNIYIYRSDHSRPPRCENWRDFAWRISIRYRRGDHRRPSRRLALISTPSYVYRINHDTRVQTLLQIAGGKKKRKRKRKKNKKKREERRFEARSRSLRERRSSSIR